MKNTTVQDWHIERIREYQKKSLELREGLKNIEKEIVELMDEIRANSDEVPFCNMAWEIILNADRAVYLAADLLDQAVSNLFQEAIDSVEKLK